MYSNSIIVRVKTSIYEFGEDTIQSITLLNFRPQISCPSHLKMHSLSFPMSFQNAAL
jgi:hypothetical protein